MIKSLSFRGSPLWREGVKWSDVAEHVIISHTLDELKVVGAHRVVVHKQLASEGFIVEVAGDVAISLSRSRSVNYVEVDVAIPLKVLEQLVHLVAGMDGNSFFC